MVTLFIKIYNALIHLVRALYILTFGWLIIVCITIALISKDELTASVAVYITSGYVYTIVFFIKYYKKLWENKGTFWKSIINLFFNK